MLAAEPIDSNIETDYEKPRKRKLPARYIETSVDDDLELENENMPLKRRQQIPEGSRREMQRMETDQNCQDVSQKNRIPSPAPNIREQLAALKVKVHSKKMLKSNEESYSTRKKVLTVKKIIRAVNDKVSSRKSPLKGKK